MNKEAEQMETDAPRRAVRSRKLPSWLRSPSPTPLSTPRPPSDPTQRTSAQLETTNKLSSPPISPEETHATGPGKRIRRPNSMYKPPEALTADSKRASPPNTVPKCKSTPTSSSLRPKSKSHIKSEENSDSPTSARITLRFSSRSPQPSTNDLQMPPIFTRRGERITEPTRRRQSNKGTATDETYMSGIMSPKPVRTAAGIGRVGPAPVSDDDDDDDGDDNEVDELARNALHVEFAERAWSVSVQDAPKSGAHAVPASAPDAESDGDDDNDFHRTMLLDAELDMLTRVDSPKGSEYDGPLTDGHMTTPASPGSRDSPSWTRSCSPTSDENKDTVFVHALPVPHSRSSESGAHAGSITLSLPYEFAPGMHHDSLQHEAALASPILDAHGDTPLTPVHTVTAAELAEKSDKEDDKNILPSLVTPSLPSDLSRVSPTPIPRSPDALMGSTMTGVDAAGSASANGDLDSLPAAPLLEDAFESSDQSPTPREDIIPRSEIWLDTSTSMKLPLRDDADMDPLFNVPDKIMALTDLDRAWGSPENLEPTACPVNDRKRSMRSTHAQSKRRHSGNASTCATYPRSHSTRLRSRAL